MATRPTLADNQPSSIAPKKKPIKKEGTGKPAQAQGEPKPKGNGAASGGMRKTDAELENLEIKRKAVLIKSKWTEKVEELNTMATMSIDRASAFADCAEFLVMKINIK